MGGAFLLVCCALAAIILVQILTPLRRLRVFLGGDESSVNEETNWQPGRIDLEPASPSAIRARLSPFILAQLFLLAGLLVLHASAP